MGVLILSILTFALLVGEAPLRGVDLAAVNIQLHDYEDGPPLPTNHTFRASETVFLSFQISGFKATEEDHIQLTYEIATSDAIHRAVGPVKSGIIEAELAPEDKKEGRRWQPKVRYQMKLPVTPAPGTYQIQVRIDDKIGGGKAASDVTFAVDAPRVAPGEALSIQNFRFLRSQNEKDRIPDGGAVRPGDAVWARFDITGYKFGPNNRYEVKYGISLKDAAGKTLFENAAAAQDKDESFYPRTFIPGELTLNLDRKIARGEYSVIIALSDAVGSQTLESTHVFQVE